MDPDKAALLERIERVEKALQLEQEEKAALQAKLDLVTKETADSDSKEINNGQSVTIVSQRDRKLRKFGEHSDEVVRFYCEPCETCICVLCTFNEHKDHEITQFGDAVVKYKATKNLEFWFGQTKLPGNRERVISSQALQFVDRSLVNSRFNIDRGSGIQFRSHHKLGNQFMVNLAGSWSNHCRYCDRFR